MDKCQYFQWTEKSLLLLFEVDLTALAELARFKNRKMRRQFYRCDKL